ncbi:glycosyltransferase family 39 protein [bacterium]|nr:glycosyltransferase family 39 protein [bacterium]
MDRAERVAGGLAPLAWVGLSAFAMARLMIYLFTGAPGEFGWFRDELYYLACADHLAWGYVDHPPLSVFLLAVGRFLLGESLFAVRLVSSLVSSLWLIGIGLLAREMGGDKRAQLLAAVLAFAAPQFWGMHGYYSMNVFDGLFWLGAFLLMARMLRIGDQKLWLALGFWLGIGLLNKISLLWFGAGLLVALLISPQRRWLLNWRPYAGAGIAFLLFSPYLIWQMVHDWPTLLFMRNAMQYKYVDRSLLDLLSSLVLDMHPATLPFWLGGFVALLFYKPIRAFRPLAWLFITVLAILTASGSAKPSYLSPSLVLLFAAGAILLSGWTRNKLRWLPLAITLLTAAQGLPFIPFAIPVLDEEEYVSYAELMGIGPSTSERKELGPLPQHFADRHGWEELAVEVSTAYQSLTPEEQLDCAVLVWNYGEAGAIDYYRSNNPLPPVYCGHNNYYLWGPPAETASVWIILGAEEDDLMDEFEQVEMVGEWDNPWAMPYERHQWIRICRQPYRTIQEIWPELRNFN